MIPSREHWPPSCGLCSWGMEGAWESAGRWKMTQPWGRRSPAHQLAVLCLTGNQPDQRSAFSLGDCQSSPEVEGERGQVPREWARIRPYLLHQLSVVCSPAGAAACDWQGGFPAWSQAADLRIWEALYKPRSDSLVVGMGCLRPRE